jgi:hypothetical protein
MQYQLDSCTSIEARLGPCHCLKLSLTFSTNPIVSHCHRHTFWMPTVCQLCGLISITRLDCLKPAHCLLPRPSACFDLSTPPHCIIQTQSPVSASHCVFYQPLYIGTPVTRSKHILHPAIGLSSKHLFGPPQPASVPAMRREVKAACQGH